MAAESALDAVNRGFTAVKFDPAGLYPARRAHVPPMSDISQSVAFCKTIREATIAPAFRSALGINSPRQAHQSGWGQLGACTLVRRTGPPDNLAEMAKVAGNVASPIATGERLTTKARVRAPLYR
jgi:L-alanine-DL-glutamate epimerase-like enolase superfamily enzyme